MFAVKYCIYVDAHELAAPVCYLYELMIYIFPTLTCSLETSRPPYLTYIASATIIIYNTTNHFIT